MKVILRQIPQKIQNVINSLKQEFEIKTYSKLILHVLDDYYKLKMISKRNNQELVNLRTAIAKHHKFENDIKMMESNKDCYNSKADIYHKISNSLFELNNEENDEEYY